MSRRLECDVCGLAACDLPDGVDSEAVFAVEEDGRSHCQVCELPETEPDDEPEDEG